MHLLLVVLILLVGSGVISLLAGRWWRVATAVGAGGCVAACLAGLGPVVSALGGAAVEPLRLPWSVPLGAFVIGLDALSAWFALAVLGLSLLAAAYGSAYLAPYRQTKNLGASWFFYNLLVASMLLVVLARDGMLFLVAWEVMSLASYFLVTFEDEREAVRQAGWTYLVATHIGTAFLLMLFMVLGRGGSLEFANFEKFAAAAPGLVSLAFILAVIGFGTKAGFLPLHVWLPEAHPAAPSHVSAVMSGVMIKTGIYGLVRTLSFLGPMQEWWGWVLVGVGAASGVLGVLFALAQHDLKRLLAYHSVENIGIIALGLGVGVIGASHGWAAVAVLGFAGGLLHVMNHALFKGLLFLGAGSVVHATHTRDIDLQGGLLRRMPWTGATFLVGAAAICGLPPLNGFISEFLVYVGAFRAAAEHGSAVLSGAVVIGSLALIGGLAAACFTKAFGILFLGGPRSESAAQAHESPWAMKAPMIVLAAGCVLVGVLGPLIVTHMGAVIAPLTGSDASGAGAAAGSNAIAAEAAAARNAAELQAAAGWPLACVLGCSVALAALVTLLVAVRRKLQAGRAIEQGPTWDCGYAAPSARMQYTASSFAQPIVDLFGLFLRTKRHVDPPRGLFPVDSSLATHTDDPFAQDGYRPTFRAIAWVLSKLRWLQHGRIQLYVLYIALTLLVLLVWKLG